MYIEKMSDLIINQGNANYNQQEILLHAPKLVEKLKNLQSCLSENGE